MGDELFIESVKKYPCLWNTQLTTYKCNETKDATWQLVVNETNIQNVNTAKAKWKKLRDNHRDAIKRQNATRSGQATKQIKSWKYQKLMEFLLPYMCNRNRTTNYEQQEIRSPGTDDTRMSAGSSTENNWKSQEELLLDIECILSEPTTDNSQNSTTQNAAPSPSHSSHASSTTTNKRKADDITELLQKHQENHQQLMKEQAGIKEILTAPDNVDEVDHFFLGMAKSVKKLPAYLQRQVKRNAMNALMEAEEVNEQHLWTAPNYGYCTSTDSNTSANYSKAAAPLKRSGAEGAEMCGIDQSRNGKIAKRGGATQLIGRFRTSPLRSASVEPQPNTETLRNKEPATPGNDDQNDDTNINRNLDATA